MFLHMFETTKPARIAVTNDPTGACLAEIDPKAVWTFCKTVTAEPGVISVDPDAAREAVEKQGWYLLPYRAGGRPRAEA